MQFAKILFVFAFSAFALAAASQPAGSYEDYEFGEVFAETTIDYRTCEEGNNPMPRPDCPDEDPEGHPPYFPYPYDCTKYFECTNGVAKCIQCPTGTVWDQDLLVCNHEAVVPCTTVPTVPTTPTTTPPPTTTTPTTTTTTPTTTPTTTTTTTTPPPTTTTTTTTEPPPSTTDDPINWICPEGYVGKMGHPYDCRLFYMCDPGRRPCLYECPSDLYYNPDTEQCDWPANVPVCKGGSPPPPTSTTVNYRNIQRFRMKSVFQEETTRNPCDNPSLRFEYY